jgi:hypothetical protein
MADFQEAKNAFNQMLAEDLIEQIQGELKWIDPTDLSKAEKKILCHIENYKKEKEQ